MGFQTNIETAFHDGFWREALRSALHICTHESDEKAVVNALAWCTRLYCYLGLLDDAERSLNNAVERKSQNTPLLCIASAEYHCSRGHLVTAYAEINDGWQEFQLERPANRATLLATFSLVETARGHAETGYSKAVLACSDAEETPPEIRATTAYALAQSSLALQRLDEASEAIQHAHTLRSAFPKSPWVAEALDLWGRIQRHQKDPFGAVERHLKAQSIWRSDVSFYAAPLAANYHMLAQAKHRCGAFSEAREYMAESVHLTQQCLGATHVDTWISRFELARYTIDCGDLTQGFTALAKAREEVESRLGPNHPVVLSMSKFI